MPNRCCVQNCRTNYDSKSETLSVFRFPQDTDVRRTWLRNIQRIDFQPRKTSVVCEKHFEEALIIRKDTFIGSDGQTHEFLRRCARLKDGAIPTVFSFISEEKKEEISPEEEIVEISPEEEIGGISPEQEIVEISTEVEISPEEEIIEIVVLQNTDKTKVDSFVDPDELQNLTDLKCKFSTWEYADKWYRAVNDSYIVFFKIDATEIIPFLQTSITVNCDMIVSVCSQGRIVDKGILDWLLGLSSPNLRRWSQFEKLLNHFEYSQTEKTVNDFVIDAIQQLKHALDSSTIEDEEKMPALRFVIEQLTLLSSTCINQRRYSDQLLSISHSLYKISPVGYRTLRALGCLNFPHPTVIRSKHFKSKIIDFEAK